MDREFVKSIYRNVLLALIITLVLLFLWYLPVIYSLGRPTALRVFPALQPKVETALAKEGGDRLVYSRLGIDVPFTLEPGVAPWDQSTWDTLHADLRKGIALTYLGDSLENSPVVYALGHSSEAVPGHYSAVFAGLGQAVIGDEFTVLHGKTALTYKVVEKRSVDPSKVVSSTQPVEGQHRLVLVCCWPVPTVWQRLTVIAELQPSS